ncbi:acetyltransferase [Paenibacillus taiwanensis]|uniref:acetyltransferase n=1 Tax=Paenibacillus taiwanensis TaxID=401638 RepID=UPI0004040770|nr:acetyltransferase [Paenibacillus taiwanensis]
MNPLIIIGAGGQGREVAQCVRDINRIQDTWKLIGYVDDNEDIHGMKLNDIPVVGSLRWLTAEIIRDVYVVCAIGSSLVRRSTLDRIERTGMAPRYATIIHPTSVIAEEVDISEGAIICAHTVVSTNVKLDKHVIINYGASIGHDSTLKSCVTILPGARISGHVLLESGCDIGSNAVVIPMNTIGENTIVGAGAVVTRSLPPFCTAVGVPAKPIKYHNIIHNSR